jgi:hypothetical protein
VPLPYDDLNREYRAALRREVQLRRQLQEKDEVILRVKGKLLKSVQEIDLDLQRMARSDERTTTANDVHRMPDPR